jgi:hypothetical protein
MPISSSWRQAPWGSRADFFFQPNTCCNSPYVTSSLTRRWVCLVWICLADSSHNATDGQSVSLGVEPHLGLMTRYLLLFDSCDLVLVGRPLWREDGYMLQTLASASPGTRDHILLSQIWDFPFRRLLRLAGSRWRYSTPPPREAWRTRLVSLGTDRVENIIPNSSSVLARGLVAMQHVCFAVVT